MNNKKGFTLIELSIVLVIIGLIVGGILAGQELIRSATLKSVITDEQKYVTAVNVFRTKYNELPGDMVDATNIWGADPNGCPDYGPGWTSPQVKTCNGNGNGVIESVETGGSTNINENFRAWQQLADAALIPGSYSGFQGPASSSENVPGLNVPASKIPNAGFEWTVFSPPDPRVPASYWNGQYNIQYMMFGSSYVFGSSRVGFDSGNVSLDQAVLSPSDALAIDLKIDDGLPYSGNVLASGYQGQGVGGNCGMNYGYGNQYNISVSIIQCTLLFAVKSW